MNVITPVDVSLITKAVQSLLLADTRLADVPVERSEPPPESPDHCPWVGVYRLGVTYPQRQLMGVSGFRSQHVRLLVMVQAANGTSGEACEEELEALLKNVLSALMSDTTLKGAVSNLDEFDVNYTAFMKTEEGGFMQTAALQFVALTNTTVGG